MVASQDPASFRDPAGFVFRDENATLYRQVNRRSAADYRALIDSGLYKRLANRGLLVEHEEVSVEKALTGDGQFVIHPRELPFISYPYEWSFSGLKQAALLTLEVQRQALSVDMSLKDASSFNVQFEGTRPVFIDTLSFERRQPGSAWCAYGQFCRHFLAPLTLMARTSIGLNCLLATCIDGIPLDLTTRLLPWSTRLNPRALMHLYLQAMLVRRFDQTSRVDRSRPPIADRTVSQRGLCALVDSLEAAVRRLDYRGHSHWVDYYTDNSYGPDAFQEKQKVVREFLVRTRPETVWDLGANTGVFSQLALNAGATTLAFDADPVCVDRQFRSSVREPGRSVLPLVMDLANPSPALGWAHCERMSLADRGPADVVMSLALIHHLAITHNLPLEHIADYLAKVSRHLIIEFVPQEDPQSRRLLEARRTTLTLYDGTRFENAFDRHFQITSVRRLGEGGRVIYLMRRR